MIKIGDAEKAFNPAEGLKRMKAIRRMRPLVSRKGIQPSRGIETPDWPTCGTPRAWSQAEKAFNPAEGLKPTDR